MHDEDDLTLLIAASAAGDAGAAGRVWERVYHELRVVARARMAGLGPGATLDTTALVHESFLRLVGGGPRRYASRRHFYATAAKAMRQIVIDHLRRRGAQRRQQDPDVAEGMMARLPWPDELVQTAQAFDALQALDPHLAQVAELHIFAGLDLVEIGALLGRSERSMRRDWQKARALLAMAMEAHGDDADA